MEGSKMMRPEIRFKGFEEDCEEITLGQLCSVNRGVRVTRKELINQGCYPVYQNTDYPMGYYNRFNVKENNPFVIIGGSAGLIGFSYKAFWAADDCAYFGDNSNVNKFYLYYVLLRKYLDIKKNVRWSSIPRLDRKVLCDLNVTYPTLQEQQKIAEYFTSLDKQIEATSKKIESLKRVKAASLQSMFPQEGETKPRVRFKGFEGEWVKTSIGELGYTYSGITGKSKDDFGKGNAQYITFLNVLNNAEIDKSILEIVDINNEDNQNAVQKGDLFFNTSSETSEEVGMCSVLNEDVEKVYLNSFCFGFRLNKENVCSTFIAYLMRGPIGRKIMSTLGQGATRINLSKNSFCKSFIMLPSELKEQELVASYLQSLDKQITLYTKRLERMKQIKASCLDKMFM